MSFITRNFKFAVKNPRKTYAVRKVMKTHRQAYPYCAWCGRDKTKKHVHHIVPISWDASRAADPSNLMTLCAKRCHLTVGHGGNWKDRVGNLPVLCGHVSILKKG